MPERYPGGTPEKWLRNSLCTVPRCRRRELRVATAVRILGRISPQTRMPAHGGRLHEPAAANNPGARRPGFQSVGDSCAVRLKYRQLSGVRTGTENCEFSTSRGYHFRSFHPKPLYVRRPRSPRVCRMVPRQIPLLFARLRDPCGLADKRPSRSAGTERETVGKNGTAQTPRCVSGLWAGHLSFQLAIPCLAWRVMSMEFPLPRMVVVMTVATSLRTACVQPKELSVLSLTESCWFDGPQNGQSGS